MYGIARIPDHEHKICLVLIVDVCVRLTVQMESMIHSAPSTRDQGPDTTNDGAEGILQTELKIAQEELDTMAKLNSRLGYEIKRNELALSNMMKNYDGRQQFAKRLEDDVNKVENPSSSGNTNNSKKGLNKIEVRHNKNLHISFMNL